MGWTSWEVSGKPNKIELVKEYINSDRTEVIYTSKYGNQVYCAVKCKENDGEKICGVVALTSIDTDEFGRRWFGIKLVDETMGPYSYMAPIRLIDMLSPTTNEYALEWRRNCKRYQRNKNLLDSLNAGTRMEINNSEKTLVVVMVIGGKKFFVHPDNGALYKISKDRLCRSGFKIFS